MAVYTIADLHLSGSVNKPMDIFGYKWQDHAQKIERAWTRLVTDADTVVIPGDISWGIDLDEAMVDLLWIDRLPGKKIISKGNHDYWWSTVTKMKRAFEEHGITTIDFLHNNAFSADGLIICGTRGWYSEEKQQAKETTDYRKIVTREAARLETSLAAAKKLAEGTDAPAPIVFLHFPAVFNSFICRELIDVMHKYGVRRCYFGHIHGTYTVPAHTDFEGIRFSLISADFLDFVPYLVRPPQQNGADL